MRLILAVIVLVIAVAAVIWFTMPQLVPAGWRPAAHDAGARATSETSSTAAARDGSPPLYKWRDAQGVWNITDRPPSDRPYERVVVDPNQNVVPTGVAPWSPSIPSASQPEQKPPPR